MGFLRAIRRILLTVLAGGLLSATLLRFTPGLGMDESQLDPRWRQESLERLRASGHDLDNPLVFYGRYLAGYVTGDWGLSRVLERPVADLVRERALSTGAAVATGLALAWGAALLAGVMAVRYPTKVVLVGATASAVLLQCLPAAVLGLLLVLAGGRGILVCGLALGLILYSRLLPLVRNILEQVCSMPHVLLARAQGADEWRVLWRQILAVSAPELLSAAGVSVSLALSVAIPIETLLDLPGLGQLAWQAALGRDVYLLVNLTVLMTVVVLLANSLSDWGVRRLRGIA